MKLRLMFFLITIGVFFVIPIVSAEIFIEQLDEIYNVGDVINSPISVIANSPISDHFLVDIVCGPVQTNIFNQFLISQTGQQQSITATTNLIGDYFTSVQIINQTNVTLISGNETNVTSGNGTIGNSTLEVFTEHENCYLSVAYGSEISSSNAFIISRGIVLDLELNLDKFDPGETVTISGIAEKESGTLVNGFAELFVNSLTISQSKTVSNGEVSFDFVIPQDGKSGEHNVTIRVYETDIHGEVTSEGFYEEYFSVRQILKDLEITMNSENAEPGSDFGFKVITYDQADDLISEDISIVVYKPGDFVFFKKLIKPDSEQIINFALNNTPGYWKIEASAGSINKKKLFYLEQVQKIQTSLINNTLIITNIGNVIYEKPLEITIGSTVEIRQLKLKVGETQTLKLKAPDGDYQISVNDGTAAEVLGTTFLTGNAIRIVDINLDFLEVLANPNLWWVVVIVFVLIVIFVYVKRRVLNKSKGIVANDKFKVANKKPSSEILQGSKEKAQVIAVKSKIEKDSDYIAKTINKALTVAKNSGAKVYVDGDFKIIVFSPRLTRKSNNEIAAVTIAKKIDSILKEHNKHYKDKIVYGIGVNDGEIVSELANEQFKFTTLGSLISGAKRIAQRYDMKVLLSETMHRKVINTIKTEKSKDGDSWEVTKMADREKYKDFLKKISDKKN